MKQNLIVIAFFAVGCLAGLLGEVKIDTHQVSLCVLYALMFQVGLGMGSNKELKQLLGSLNLRMLLVPAATVCGTLVFSAAAALLLSRWSVTECLAVGSGFAYYSLSSVLIVQLKEASIGIDMASQLGAIALLANMIREMLAIMGVPLYSRLGKLAPVSVAGITSMDICLPAISRYVGKDMIPVAIIHGLILELSVPFLVTSLCS